MVGSINPVVHGNGRRGWRRSMALYGLGAAASAGLAGAAIAWVGSRVSGGLEQPAAFLLAAGLAVAYAIHELGGWTLPAPQIEEQVPSGWRVRFPLPVASLLYGVVLGPGLFTRIFTSSYYVLVAWVFLLLEPAEGALVMLVHGAARAIPQYLKTREIDTAETAYEIGLAIPDHQGLARRVNGIVLLGFGVTAVALGAS